MSGAESRALEEWTSLKQRVNRLTEFVDSEEFEVMPPGHQRLLYVQLEHMTNYANVLGRRIQEWI